MKSPDEEDSRNIDQHDPSEVVRVANIFVDEVITKAQEEALIKYQKRQEENESSFDEGKHKKPPHAVIPETSSIIVHDPEKLPRTIQKSTGVVPHQSHHQEPVSRHLPRPLESSSHNMSQLTLLEMPPSTYFSGTAFQRGNPQHTRPSKTIKLKIFLLLFCGIIMYIGIYFLYKMIKLFHGMGKK